MDPPRFDGTNHPLMWIKQIRSFCYLKQIKSEKDILEFSIGMVLHNGNSEKQNNSCCNCQISPYDFRIQNQIIFKPFDVKEKKKNSIPFFYFLTTIKHGFNRT